MCAAAWREAFAPINPDLPFGPATKIAIACAAAYCPHLPSAPALCARSGDTAGKEGASQLDAIRDLDTAILKFEGLDAAAARAIAARIAVLEVSVIKAVDLVSRARQPGGKPVSLVLVIDDTGKLVANGSPIDRSALGRLLDKLAGTDGQLVLKAGRGTPHAKVVEVMEQAKQAGVNRIAIATDDGGLPGSAAPAHD